MLLSAGKRVSKQDKPKINPVSHIIEPTPLPNAKPLSPRKAAVTEVNISGAVVPNETTVAPMMTVLIPKPLANATAELTVLSAPMMSTHILPAVNNQSRSVL